MSPLSDHSEQRRNARTLITEAVFNHEAASRGRIAYLTHLSMSTVARETRALLSRGILDEVDASRSGRGRHPKNLVPGSRLGYVVGLDLGMGRLRAVGMDMSGRQILEWEGVTPTTLTQEILVPWVSNAVAEAVLPRQGEPPKFVVISVPDRIEDNRWRSFAPPPAGGVPVAENTREVLLDGDRLTDRIGAPTRLENESVAALVAELRADQSLREKTAVLVSVSQHVTGAVSINGTIIRGGRRQVGLFGRIPFRGTRESVETVVTFPTLVEDLLHDAQESSREPLAAFAPFRSVFLDGIMLILAAVISAVDPDTVIIDGRARALIEESISSVRQQLQKLFPDPPEIRFAHDRRLFSSAHGCASLAVEAARRDVLSSLALSMPE